VKLTFFIALVAFLLSGCKKQSDKEVIPPAGDYFPLTARSYWSYLPDNSNTGFGMYGEVIISTTSVNGKTYSVLNYDPGNTRFANFVDSALFRKEGGKYYQAMTYQQLFFPLDEPGIYEFVFMEDNAPVGAHWSNKVTGTFTFSNGRMRMDQDYQGQISEFLHSFQLDDKHTFSDVVRVTIYMTALGYGPNNELLYQNSIAYDKWYARNKGLIKAMESSPVGFAQKLDTLVVY
jgi:hypothetical protein